MYIYIYLLKTISLFRHKLTQKRLLTKAIIRVTNMSNDVLTPRVSSWARFWCVPLGVKNIFRNYVHRRLFAGGGHRNSQKAGFPQIFQILPNF